MSESASASRNYSAEKVRVLATLAIATFVFGLIAGAPNDASPVTPVAFVLGLVVTFSLILQWCRIDADQHEFVLWRRFVFFTVVFPGPLVTVPYYLFKTRGRRAFPAFTCFVAIVIAIVAIEIAAIYCGDRIGELR